MTAPETPKAVPGELVSMALEHDELAGVVDLFGALTRAELATALDELAFKRGESGASEPRIERAIDAYRLVAFEHVAGQSVSITTDDLAADTLLAAGPTAFPTLPAGGADLPHILDVSARETDRAALGGVIEERFRADAAQAVAAEDVERMDELLDVSYDVEAWAPVELRGARERLDTALEAHAGTTRATDGSTGATTDEE